MTRPALVDDGTQGSLGFVAAIQSIEREAQLLAHHDGSGEERRHAVDELDMLSQSLTARYDRKRSTTMAGSASLTFSSRSIARTASGPARRAAASWSFVAARVLHHFAELVGLQPGDVRARPVGHELKQGAVFNRIAAGSQPFRQRSAILVRLLWNAMRIECVGQSTQRRDIWSRCGAAG